ncbi:hypothetical protein G5714_015364 [Onychostoma macrolepis]|uniref:Uncharacterized protein n=1 Tax=Onychostoma macrolepis TaxID=369639 RepID=A0A7J6CAP0_9TELE|nr:hypothetical protein G5714_015364 [Onychostoma macrolepis]
MNKSVKQKESNQRGLDHLTFGEFVEFLARSPARVAGGPQAVLTEAAAPPVVADKAAEAAAPPVAADEAAAPPAAIKGVRGLVCRTQYLQPASQSAPADTACRNPTDVNASSVVLIESRLRLLDDGAARTSTPVSVGERLEAESALTLALPSSSGQPSHRIHINPLMSS